MSTNETAINGETGTKMERKYSVVVCDNCLIAARDELGIEDRAILEERCSSDEGLPDHICLATAGYQERCDCGCKWQAEGDAWLDRMVEMQEHCTIGRR